MKQKLLLLLLFFGALASAQNVRRHDNGLGRVSGSGLFKAIPPDPSASLANRPSAVAAQPMACTTALNGQFPAGVYTPTNTGSLETITTSAWAGEFSVVAVTAGRTYVFSSSRADYITIATASGTVVAEGFSPLSWTNSNYNGNINYYLHTSSSCGNESISRTRYITSSTGGCSTPFNFSVTNVGPHSATFNWNPVGGNVQGYQLVFTELNGISPDDTYPNGTITTTTNTSTSTGFTESTRYYVWVRTICSTGNSPWAALQFTTPPATGCTAGTYGQFPSTAYTPQCTGAPESITTNGYAGEYSGVNITQNKRYTFTSSITTDLITITNSNGVTIASGYTPLVWSSGTYNGTVRFYTHADLSCTTAAVSRTRFVQCSTVNCASPSNFTFSDITSTSATIRWATNSPAALGYQYEISYNNRLPYDDATEEGGILASAGVIINDMQPSTTYYIFVRSVCDTQMGPWIAGGSFTTNPALICNSATYGVYPATAFTPSCTGSNETIATNAYAGELTYVNVTAGRQYIFSSSVATDFITITNAAGNVIYASGTGPVTWSSGTVSGNIRYFLHANGNCGDENVNRSRYVRCSSCNTVAPLASAQNFCGSTTLASLVASGINLKWYAASTGGTALTAGTTISTGTYYVSQTVSNCESSRTPVTVIVNIVAIPTASDVQICGGGTVANLVATGTNIKWYNVDFGGSPLASTTPLVTGYYFPTQTINGCESARNIVYVTVSGSATVAPVVSAQTFCGNAAVSNLVANGVNIRWYRALTGGTALTANTALVSGVYYATQTVNGCESSRAGIQVTVNNTAMPESSDVQICGGGTVANLVASGTNIKWYNVDFGGSPLASTTPLVTGYYFVTQTINGCESQRNVIYVTVSGSAVAAPTASAQTFCGDKYIIDIIASGTNLKWYLTATGGSYLDPYTELTTRTYYVSQTVNGCESSRTAVAVTANRTEYASTTNQTLCNGAIVANLVASGTAIKWYDNDNGNPLPSNTLLATGVYYVTQTVNGCESNKAQAYITIGSSTGAPTAAAQNFCGSATVANLVANGTSIKWYTAATGGTALATTTALTARTYYASQTVNGCESTRTPVVVTLGNTAAPTASAQTICQNIYVRYLVANGTNLKWYLAATGGTSLDPYSEISTRTYYVSQTVNGCESSRTPVAVTVYNTTSPTASNQTLCSGATVANLVATGSNLKWYDNDNRSNPLASTTPLVTGTYFVTQTLNGCESYNALVNVTITTTQIPSAADLLLCGTATVANLVATGTNIKWYSAVTGGTALASTAAVTTGTYFVSQTVNGCESARNAVSITVNTTTVPTAAAQNFCGSATVANLVATGTSVKWYSAATGGTPLAATASLTSATYFATQTINNCESARTPVVVTVNALPTAPVVTITQPSCSVATGTIVITAPTGTGFTYSINGTTYQASATFAIVGPGTYNVTAKNAVGCISAVSSVIINPAPSAPARPTVTATQPTCAVSTGSMVVNTPTGTDLTFSINGTTYQTSNTFSNIAAGTYSVTAKNSAGCISWAASVTINAAPAVPTAPIVTTTQPTCTVATGTIVVTAPAGTGLTFSVNGTTYQVSATFTALAAGTYNVTAKNAAGCISAVTSVTINAAPATPTAPLVTIIQPSCAVATGTIVVTAPTGTGLTFSVNGTTYQASATFTALASGVYNVTAKNAAGCISEATSVTINAAPAVPTAPVVTITQPTCTVATGSIVVTAPAGIGLTFSVNGTTYQASATFTALAAGTYNVTAKNAAGCISAVTSVTINAAPATPTAPLVTITQPSCAVATGTIIVTAPTGTGLTFSVNGTTYQASATFTALASGTYNVTAKNAAGCISAVTSVTINTPAEVPVTPVVIATQPDCATATGNIVITAPTGTGLTYSINGTTYQASATFTNVVAGTYSVTVKNATGCISAPALVLINTAPQLPATPVVSVTQPTCALPLGTVTITSPAGLTYSIDGTTFQASTVFSNVLPGTYQVTVKTVAGCTSVATVTVNAAPAGPLAPTAIAQAFCGSATVANLVATGTAVKWYTAATGGTALAATATLATGTYYATQTVNGCESPRVTVNVTITPGTVPAFTAVAPICSGTALAALPTTSTNGVTGTWSPALNNTATTTYTFTPSTGQCATTATLTITVNAPTAPAFAAVAPICSGAILAALPTTSTNGITGTWSPAVNNTATTTYTFLPAAGQCAVPATLTITVNPVVVPTFPVVAPICSGATLAALPATSTNGVTGTWSPALNNTATTTYTFTPATGQCAVTTTLTITVNPVVVPAFAVVAPICSGTALAALPTTSTNGVTGTWSPALNNTATTTYTFTPTTGQCAATASLTITVNPATVPAFATIAPICSGATLAALPTTSTNGVTGTWSPALNNTATTTYTFTPATGQCATTATLTITVNPIVVPAFAVVAPICSGATLAALPTTSTNGVTGTWSPVLNNTATTTYTFTPATGQCAATTTLTITVNPVIVPTFTAVSAICSGAALAALPTTSTNGVTGTWSPALNNTATTTYTFTPATGQCAATATLTIEVTPATVPAFASVDAICSGATLAALPTTSTNGVTGTWSPALNNTATTTYTFTPATGQCATTATLTITVNPGGTPTFASVDAICSGAILAALPTTSTNGITGTWSPALNNTATTTYTFTPASSCAAIATLTIVVNPVVVPLFTTVDAVCSGTTLAALPTTSTNGITGTWSPELNNTATTTYTFIPSAGQCAVTATLTIEVTPATVPAFAAIAPICSGAALEALPATSTNGVTGTWSPALNNTATTTYTFTPDANQCATTAALTIEVNTLDATTSLQGETITANQEGATYQWVDCANGNAVIEGATDQSYTATANGQYAVMIEFNGCNAISECVTISSLSIKNPIANNSLVIYPSPATTVLNIKTNEVIKAVKIVDLFGKTISVTNFADNKIDVRVLQAGVYFVEIQTADNKYVHKFVKD